MAGRIYQGGGDVHEQMLSMYINEVFRPQTDDERAVLDDALASGAEVGIRWRSISNTMVDMRGVPRRLYALTGTAALQLQIMHELPDDAEYPQFMTTTIAAEIEKQQGKVSIDTIGRYEHIACQPEGERLLGAKVLNKSAAFQSLYGELYLATMSPLTANVSRNLGTLLREYYLWPTPPKTQPSS
jgi:hypothetical protein